MLHSVHISRALGVTGQIGVTAVFTILVNRRPQSANSYRWRREKADTPENAVFSRFLAIGASKKL